MLKLLFASLVPWYSGFNVFQYITLRSILAIFTAMSISLIFGSFMINLLERERIRQPVREVGPKSHFSKQGTPVMGGVLILISVVLTSVLWADLTNRYIIAVLVLTLLFGLIGGVDDIIKLRQNSSAGMSAKSKIFWQTLCSFVVVYALFKSAEYPIETTLIIPFIKDVSVDLGPWFLLVATITIVGSSNAVNLTDGLDGLAIMPVVLVISALGVFAYVSSHAVFANYLDIPYLASLSGELTVYCGAVVGAGLGFLWFNTYPAQVFMGDVGALSLGAAMGLLAVLVRQEIVLVIMGGLFAVEALSVIIQVTSYRLTGKRIFRMAPLHHHFELRGWAEPKIVVRFWIITLVLVLIGIASLKIR